jgi:hypothetical protein
MFRVIGKLWKQAHAVGGFEQLSASGGKKGGPRPGLVYVLVIYIGDQAWNPDLDVFKRLPPGTREAARRAWEEPAGFVNLREEGTAPSEEDPLLAAGIFLLAHGRDPDPGKLLRRLDPLLERVARCPNGRELVHRMLLYAGQSAGRKNPERVKLFTDGIAKHLHGVPREEAMSIWQEIGKQHELQGMQQGKQQGMQQGKLEVARNLLVAGVDLKVVSKATGLPRQKLAALRKKP